MKLNSIQRSETSVSGFGWLTRLSRYLNVRYIAMVRRYPLNPRGTENVFSDIRVLSIEIYMYSPFMSYRTRFSQVFSYIIELRKKNMR